MPVVDLSNIGLEGQQAYATRMATFAQADNLKAAAEQTRIENVDKEREQLFSDAVSKMNAIAMGKSPNNGDVLGEMEDDSAAAPLDRMAELATRFGAVESARKLANTASEIRGRESTIQQNEIENNTKRLDNIIKGADVTARFLGQAKNQSEWEYGIQQLRDSGTMEPEFIDKIASMNYDPDLAAFFHEKAISAADQARLEMQQNNLDQTASFRAAALARADRTARIAEARARESERHNRTMEKVNGNKGASAVAPSARDLESAKTALKNTVFKGVEGSDVTAAAEYVASQAKALLKQNTALDWNTAVQQVIIRGQQEGAFEINVEDNWFSADKKTARFKDPASAQPPPIDKQGKVDRTKLVKGRYYKLPDGRVGKFNGSGIVVDE